MVKKVNLLPEKCGYLAKNWFIWFKPACTAQSANPSSKTWFKRPDEQYIHVGDMMDHFLSYPLLNHLGITPRPSGSTPGVDPGYPRGTQPLRRS